MPKSEIQNIGSTNKQTDKIWEIFNFLRGSIAAEDYDVFLYLMLLAKLGFNYRLSVGKGNRPTEMMLLIPDESHPLKDWVLLLQEIYEPKLRLISPLAFREFLDLAGSEILKSDEAENSSIVEAFFEAYSSIVGRSSNEYRTPIEIIKFICSYVDDRKESAVYNPFAGTAAVATNIPEGVKYIGQEVNRKTWALGLMRLLYNNKTPNHFFNSDSQNEWAFKEFDMFDFSQILYYENDVFQKFDYVIGCPPLGARSTSLDSGAFGNIRSSETFFIDRGINTITKDGVFIGVVSPSILYNSGYEEHLRKHLVVNNLIDSVILLPNGLYSFTSIPVIVLIIKKNRKPEDLVNFIDASEFIQRDGRTNQFLYSELLGEIEKEGQSLYVRKVSTNEIVAEGYNLSIRRYFKKDDFAGVQLNEIGQLLRGLRTNEGERGHYLRIRDLKEEFSESYLNLSELEEIPIPKNSFKIQQDCILVSLRWNKLKTAYFKYEGAPLYYSSDIYPLILDETLCDVSYILSEFHVDYVAKQYEAFLQGTLVPSIKREDFLRIKIVLPPLLEQKDRVRERVNFYSLEKKKEINLFNRIHGLETEIIDQNTYLRHTLAGPASNMRGALKNVLSILAEHVHPVLPDIMNKKVSDVYDMNFGDYLKILERDILKISNAVQSQLRADVDIYSRKRIQIDFLGFLKEYCDEFNARNEKSYKLIFTFDEEVFLDSEGNHLKAYILANEDLLTDMLNNLVENAETHAFPGTLNNRIELYLMKYTVDDSKSEIQLLFSNTGNPFPEGFTSIDYIRKGSKAGPHAGDGFGGWYINEIVKSMGGELDIIDETDAEGLPGTDLATSFEIIIPLTEVDSDE